jgi:hypothetical protein
MNWLKRFFSQPPSGMSSAHNLALLNFTYVKQPGEGRVYDAHDIRKPFRGDCDDFAVSMALALMGDASYIEFYLPSGEYHAACLYKGWVSDNLRRAPYPESELPKVRLKLHWMDIHRLARKEERGG